MHATRLSLPLLPVLLCLALAACSPAPTAPAEVQSSVLGFLSLDQQRVRLRDGQSLAEISADGALSIDGRAIALNPQQQALSRSYYSDARAVALEGAAMGAAGAKLAGDAIKGAIGEALKGGNPDQAGKQVEQQAGELEKSAQRMCEHVARLHRTQQALSDSLPAFKPFARLQASDIDDCKK